MRDEDSCSDEEQPPPAKHSKKAALKQAVPKANGKWPTMSALEKDVQDEKVPIP